MRTSGRRAVTGSPWGLFGDHSGVVFWFSYCDKPRGWSKVSCRSGQVCANRAEPRLFFVPCPVKHLTWGLLALFFLGGFQATKFHSCMGLGGSKQGRPLGPGLTRGASDTSSHAGKERQVLAYAFQGVSRNGSTRPAKNGFHRASVFCAAEHDLTAENSAGKFCTARLARSFVCSFVCLFVCVVCLLAWLAGWLVACLALLCFALQCFALLWCALLVWLVGCLFGWLACWLNGWLVSYLIN